VALLWLDVACGLALRPGAADVVVCDPPFGQKHAADVVELYPQLCRTIAAALALGSGVAAVLCRAAHQTLLLAAAMVGSPAGTP
jgi:23S rRNA G2445 N2-methylase RlmL